MLNTILTALFPRRCVSCRKLGTALCDHCLHKIRCADNTGVEIFAVYDYGNSFVRGAIKAFKYYRRSEVIRVLARAGVPFIQEFIGDTIQSTRIHTLVLVPIPEHPRKLRIKGFNQSEVLARWWSAELPGSRVHALLEKTIFTMPQAHLRRTARLQNVANTMRTVQMLNPQSIYLIVDDVTTTGATFAEAQRALRAGGAKKIFSIALAHGYVGRN